jgi:hypothetical protein
MRLSQSQIAALWVAEGGSPSKADLASAVSMAESGGDSTAGNSCCHGLWQLNVEVGVSSMKCATNPVCSTRKAISLSKNGKDWQPWEAFTNGSYRQFLGGGGHTRNRQQAQSVLASSPGGQTIFASFGGDVQKAGEAAIDPLSVIPGVPNPLGGIETSIGELGELVKFFKDAGELLFSPEGWLRLGKMFGGAILLLWGLRVLVRESTLEAPASASAAVQAAKPHIVKKAAETAASVAAVVK